MNTTLTIKIDSTTHSLLEELAQKVETTKSSIVRAAINAYLAKKTPSGVDTFLEIAEEAKKYKFEIPKDLVENLDAYLYEKI
jgi:predicted transcriptional regulator